MSSYNRDYMRRPSWGGEFWALKWLVIGNAGFFILQTVFTQWFGSHVLNEYLSLSTHRLFHGFFWTLLSYSFLHADFFHVLINLLVIFFMGKALEERYGSRQLLVIYFVSVLFGGLVWLTASGGGLNYLVGASAGAFGLLAFFCLTQPEQPITLLLFFVIPVTMKPKWILWGMLGIEGFLFVFYELPGRSVIASSAHLGGILGGFIIFKIFTQPGWLTKLKKVTLERPESKKDKIFKGGFKVNIKNEEAMAAEVDRILDKINGDGFGALTPKEKETLEKAKKHLDK